MGAAECEYLVQGRVAVLPHVDREASGEFEILLGRLRNGNDVVDIGQELISAKNRSRLEDPRWSRGGGGFRHTSKWLAGAEFVERASGVSDLASQPQSLVEKRVSVDVVRPKFGDGCGGTEEGRGDASGSDVHEQGFVVGTEVVPDCAVEGEAALKAEVVAVPGMGEDGDGAAETGEVEDLADTVAN